jgi:hypothetical protein
MTGMEVVQRLFLRYGWLLYISLTCAVGVRWWRRGTKCGEGNTWDACAWRSPVLGLLVFGNLPWVVMGWGISVGGQRSILEFLNPANGSAAAAFHLTVIVFWLVALWWVRVRKGDAVLSKLDPALGAIGGATALVLLGIVGYLLGVVVAVLVKHRPAG